ncbi:FDXHR family putative zinc-binding protein [Saccharopolyspora oryzae]
MGEQLTCHQCPNTWTGTSRCHCSSCHHTFSGLALFDRHRRNGRCHHPETLRGQAGERLAHLRGGLWAGPEMTNEQKAEAWG